MTISFDFNIYREDYHQAGKASSEIKKYLTQIGFSPALIRQIVICSYEAEMNLVIHSYGGKMFLHIEDNIIKIITKDTGPGINNIELALKPGYSTASREVRQLGYGAGLGLPNMKKNAHKMDVKSSSKGTLVLLLWVIG